MVNKNVVDESDEELKFSVKIADIKLELPFMNGAGTCKILEGSEGVEAFVRAPLGAVMVGSITVEPMSGNSGEVLWHSESFSLNAMGLQNPGLPYYEQNLRKMVDLAHENGKPLFVSVAGFSSIQYTDLVLFACEQGVDFVELNLSCPNIWCYRGGNGRRQQLRVHCYDMDFTYHILRRIEDEVDFCAGVGIKVAPFVDPQLLAEIAGLISSFAIVKAVTICNTFPNAFAFNNKGKPAITNDTLGLGGLSGLALKPIALGQVVQFRRFLPDYIQIIGAGGVSSAQDIIEFQKAGAVAVQITTALLKGTSGLNLRVFDRLLSGLVNLNE